MFTRGTIYRAAGWTVGAISKPRVRDRSKPRVGTRRAYRSNLNGPASDGAGKIRWEKEVRAPRLSLGHGVAGQVYDPFGSAQAESNAGITV